MQLAYICVTKSNTEYPFYAYGFNILSSCTIVCMYMYKLCPSIAGEMSLCVCCQYNCRCTFCMQLVFQCRYGGKVTQSISKKTSYLVVGEDAGESKLAKVRWDL